MRICQEVASTRYVVEDHPERDSLGVTVSIGVAVRGKADSVRSLIERADRALYAAKHTGKNRVVSEKEVRNARRRVAAIFAGLPEVAGAVADPLPVWRRFPNLFNLHENCRYL